MATSTEWLAWIKRRARISTEWLRGIKLSTIGRMTHVHRISCKKLSWVKLPHTVLPCIKRLSTLKTWLSIYNPLVHIVSIVLAIISLVHRLSMLVQWTTITWRLVSWPCQFDLNAAAIDCIWLHTAITATVVTTIFAITTIVLTVSTLYSKYKCTCFD